MEDKTYYGNQPKEIDAAYIDQLLSAPVVPKKEPEPQPEPEPVVSEPPAPAEPAAKPFPKPLLILIAIALLGTGFLLGRLSLPNPEPQPTTSTYTTPTQVWVEIDTIPYATLPGGYIPNSGIAVDYVSMSTTMLASYAVQIRGLDYYGDPASNTRLSKETYKTLKQSNPVLVELEQRPDAVEKLTAYTEFSSNTIHVYAANALITYFVDYLGFSPADEIVFSTQGAWIREVGDTYTIYEHTQAPLVTYVAAVGGDDAIRTVFDFGGGDQYVLLDEVDKLIDHVTFWYRIELRENAAAILANEPEPTLKVYNSALQLSFSSSDINGNFVLIQPYENGWFVYGCANDNLTVDFSFHLDPLEYATQNVTFSVYPQPGEDATATEVAEYVLKQGSEILALQKIYGDLYYDQYPPLKLLLETEGSISALLNLAQKAKDEYSNISSVQPQYITAINLLTLPAVVPNMTEDESDALYALSMSAGYFSVRTISRIPLSGDDYTIDYPGIEGYVGKKPLALTSIDIDELNSWCYVALTPSGQILYQERWTLKVTAPNDADRIGIWEVYDNTTDQLIGWLVSSRLTSSQAISLELKQRTSYVDSQQHTPLLLDPEE